jgi:hypothetical protein
VAEEQGFPLRYVRITRLQTACSGSAVLGRRRCKIQLVWHLVTDDLWRIITGWWYGVVGHLESCNPNEHLCRCHEDGNDPLFFVILFFRLMFQFVHR